MDAEVRLYYCPNDNLPVDDVDIRQFAVVYNDIAP